MYAFAGVFVRSDRLRHHRPPCDHDHSAAVRPPAVRPARSRGCYVAGFPSIAPGRNGPRSRVWDVCFNRSFSFPEGKWQSPAFLLARVSGALPEGSLACLRSLSCPAHTKWLLTTASVTL